MSDKSSGRHALPHATYPALHISVLLADAIAWPSRVDNERERIVVTLCFEPLGSELFWIFPDSWVAVASQN